MKIITLQLKLIQTSSWNSFTPLYFKTTIEQNKTNLVSLENLAAAYLRFDSKHSVELLDNIHSPLLSDGQKIPELILLSDLNLLVQCRLFNYCLNYGKVLLLLGWYDDQLDFTSFKC